MLRRLIDPDISTPLLRDQGEVIVDEVRHHWVAFTRAVLEAVLALVLLVGTFLVPTQLSTIVLLLALAVATHACFLALREHRDRFVITNMRVFRVHGVLSTQIATMPLSRILDITLTKPLLGRVLGYGHFVFESAAQEQGLRDIRFVARPDDRDHAIQSVVQRAGLRPAVG
ncbi:MAG: PH domain-containing protein [Nocardioides sp.]|uniref:PH domain-containing protein n=1 Tax=Nocardioides sp. TaxID=35761 RepID=UPI0039E5FB5A